MAEVSDIGEIPPVKNPERREACRLNLALYLVTYFPHSTGLTPFSDDHRRVISRMQSVVLDGGRQANVVYRGFSKTTISENTALWATSYGHRNFVPVFGAEAKAAEGIIDSIKRELETNDLLYEDFPEICHAIRALEGKPQRQHSQHHNGKRTFVEFTAAAVVLPTIEGSIASGAILTSHGLTAAGRGMKYKRADGTNARPDLVIIDDAQTEESAASNLQTAKRLKIIQKSILRMSGHRSRLGVILNGTIIEPDDLVDQLSDYKRNPSWQSERIPMIRQWSDKHEDMWLGEYARLRTTYDPELIDDQKRAHAEANAYYVTNRATMDTGCRISWETCFDPETEASAIQHAYNILIDDGADVFASECQNSPRTKESLAGITEIRAPDVMQRFNGVERGIVPLGSTHLVGHIDVQHSLLYWSLFACNEAMTGSIIDHNTFPEQYSPFFSLRDAKRKLSHAYPESQPQAAVEQGLKDLIESLFSRSWKREDGAEQPLELLLIDWSDGTMAEVVARVCRTSTWKANVIAAAGVGIGPGDKPMSQYPVRPNERRGRHWMESTNKSHMCRTVRVDANYWKSRAADGLTCPPTNPGAITLFGDKRTDHRMIADHYASEYRDRQTSDKTQSTCDVWDLKPGRENHKFDNLYNCLVAASMRGCGMTEKRTEKRRKTLEEMASEARR
jgi:hypothetical protein